MVRLIGFCLLAAVMTMLLRQMNPGMAALLCVAFGAMTLLMLLPAVGEYAAQIRVPSSIMRKFIYKSGRTQSAQGRKTCP